MKLARITSPAGTESLLASFEHDTWVSLDDIEGLKGVSRVADVVGSQQLSDLTKFSESLVAERNTTSVDLTQAATIADRDADIWGAGLNYLRHSKDLETPQPRSGPGSYLRPTSCLVGNGQYIELPTQSSRVTAEAELGLVVGLECKNVARADWRGVIAGVTSVLDMTAEDVIREDPRYIPWAKGFDTFCSIGPVLVTLDEFDDDALNSLQISTIRNGEVVASATPSSMKYDLGYLVEYFTAGRTIRPGTIICTGTPGAAVIKPGDVITGTVEQVGTLTHAVS